MNSTKTNKRKHPKRKSSQLIFDSILEAGSQLFNNRNFSKVSTNKIAELAGVSIGSLYQYFPNKEVIIDILIDKMLESNRTIFVNQLRDNKESSFEISIDYLISTSFHEFMKKKFFLKVFFREIHNLNKMNKVIENRRELAREMSEIIVSKYQSEIENMESVEETLYFLFNSYIGALESYSFDGKANERKFVENLQDMFKRALLNTK